MQNSTHTKTVELNECSNRKDKAFVTLNIKLDLSHEKSTCFMRHNTFDTTDKRRTGNFIK
jgi:hypothetical protein